MMRKWILICLLVGLHCVARGQTEYAYRYWVDQAMRAEYGGMVADSIWTLDLDVDTLSEGFHQLHLQVKDTAGVWSAPQSRYFMKLMPTNVDDLKLRYWFDDAKEVYEIAGASGVHTIDVNDLAWGLHSVSYQVAGHNGIYSSATTAMFMKARMKDDTYTAQCYVGDSLYQEQTMTAEGGIVSWDLDVASLPIGLHPLRLQVNDPDGTTVSVEQSFFVRNHLNGDTYTAQCYVGDSLYNEQVLPSEGGLLDWNLDVASLPRGLHPLRLQVNDSKGTILSVAQSFFWREHTDDERGHERCFYTVDGGRTIKEAPEVAEGGYQFDVDLAPLKEGIHQLLCLIVSEEGEVLHSCNRFFMVSRPKVLRYEYWVNDDTLNTKNIIAQPMEPFKMMEQLDVEIYPLRPTSFQFAVENNRPYIYAKNNLYVKFYNDNGACTIDGRAYTDVRTRREVSDALPLEHKKPRTDATPEADSIRWYKLQVYANNRLSFRVSQPCTVQLFSPESDELLNVSGDAVTDTFVCRSTVEGVYYVALHSVTGENEQTTIEYEHESYTLTYMLNGEVYSCDTLAYGAPIITPSMEISEGYTFSGWSEMLETMPAHDVIVMGTLTLNSTQTDAQGVMYALNETVDEYVVTGYTRDLVEDIVIPAELYGVPVTTLQDEAFIGVDVLKSVVIPASVTTVGAKAFYGCDNLLVVDWNTAAMLSADIFSDTSCNMLVFVADEDTEVRYQGNLVIEGVANQIVLSDNQPFRNPRDFVARSISYSREFTKETKVGVAGGWEAMVLPFDVQRVVSETKGELKPFGEADFETSLPYWLGELQEDGTFAAVQEITANKPFIMQLPNSDEYEDIYNVDGKVTFSAEDATVHVTTDVEQEKSTGYSLQGSYEGTAADSYVYALNDEEYTADSEVYMPGGVFVANSRDIRPFEAYVCSSQVAPAPYLRIGGKGTNGIDHSTLNTQPSTIYDLMGRKVLKSEVLKKGIYILNGKLKIEN